MLKRTEVLAGISKIIQAQREADEAIKHHIADVNKMNDLQLCKLFLELTGSPIIPIGEDHFRVESVN